MSPRSPRRSKPRPAENAAVLWTVATAIATPLLLFLALALASADSAGRSEAIPAWVSGGRLLADEGPGVRIDLGPRPVALVHAVRDRDARYSRLTFEFFLRDAVEPAAQVLTRGAGERDFRGADFSGEIERAGWNPVSLSADEAPGLPGAREVGVLLASPAPNVAGLRGARLEGFPFHVRARQMAGELLRHQPLIGGSINMVTSQRVAGRGFGFLLWAGGAIALGVLLLRRLVLREPLPLLAHAAITLVVLYALADLRNSADLVMNAREAAAARLGSETLDAQLARRERVFPWFADAVRALRDRVPAGGSAWLQVIGPAVTGDAVNRAFYYGQPVRRAASLAEADVALFVGAGPDPLAGRRGWILAEQRPGGLVVYERSR